MSDPRIVSTPVIFEPTRTTSCVTFVVTVGAAGGGGGAPGDGIVGGGGCSTVVVTSGVRPVQETRQPTPITTARNRKRKISLWTVFHARPTWPPQNVQRWL